MKNNVIIGMAYEDNIRFYFAKTTSLANEILTHGVIFPHSLIPLVNTISITGIMGLIEKQDCKITTIVNGDGPSGKIYAQANNKGEVRGIITNRYVDIPLKDNHFDIPGSVGTIGNIEITKDYGLRTPYYSETSIMKGDILTDFGYYYLYSEQTPSAFSGGVKFDEEYQVTGSGILMIQAMPNCPDNILDEVSNIVSQYANLSSLLVDNSQEEILQKMFKEYKIVDQQEIKYVCDCSYEKCVTNINLLPNEDKQELLKDPVIEMTCDWCQSTYVINKNDILIN